MTVRAVAWAGVGLLLLAGMPDRSAAGKSAEDLFQAGGELEKAGDWDKALGSYQDAIRADRKFRPDAVNYRIGLCYSKLGKHGQAITPLENALRAGAFADDPGPYRLLAGAYLRQGRARDAKGAAERGIKVHASDPWLHEFLRDAFERLKDPKSARAAAEKAEALQWSRTPEPVQTAYAPPFEETWKVKAGPSEADHTGLAAKFAWDFVKVDESGAEQDPKARDKRLSSSWYGWDAGILAPADGEVTEVEAGVPDNVITGAGNALFPLGNYVIIRHSGGESSLLAALKKGSIKVKPGDKVVQGQPVAGCGNSGASLFPHLRLVILEQSDPMLCRPVALAGWNGKEGAALATGDTVKGSVAVVPVAPVSPVPSSTALTASVASSTLGVAAESATTSAPSGTVEAEAAAEPRVTGTTTGRGGE